MPMTEKQMRELARRSAVEAGLDPVMFEAQLEQESGFNPAAKSKAGALGVAQFMPRTAKSLGINPADPAEAIPAAARYMAQLKKRFGAEDLARVAYNWGEGNLSKHLKDPKAKAMPEEVANYNAMIAKRAGVELQGDPITREARAPVRGDVEAMQLATTEIGQGLPPGALTPPASPVSSTQPSWLQVLQGLPAAQSGPVMSAAPEDALALLQDQAAKDQDMALANAFGDTALPALPGQDAVPTAVDRYLDKLLAG